MYKYKISIMTNYIVMNKKRCVLVFLNFLMNIVNWGKSKRKKE